MSKFKELLEDAKKEEEGLSNRKVVFQDILAEQGDYLVQDLMDQAGQLHQTIVTLEADKKLLNQENSELKRQFQESKSRIQMLSQEMAARDKRLEEVSQSHQALVGQLKTEIQEKAARVRSLEEEIEDLKAGYQQSFLSLEEQAGQRDREVQDLHDRAKQLHQTIVTLEADKKLLNQENSELKTQFQESKSRIQMLSQEMAARDKRLMEEMEVRKGGYEQKLNRLEEDEILKGLTKERRNGMAKKLLEELLTRARPILLIVTCPDCKGNLSVRFRLRLKSKKRDAKSRKKFIEEIKKNSYHE